MSVQHHKCAATQCENTKVTFGFSHFTFALPPKSKKTMSAQLQLACRLPPPDNSSTMLARTVRNVEQAEGSIRQRTTVADILQAPDVEEVDIATPASANMISPASATSPIGNATNNAPAPAEFPTRASLTRDLTTSTALVESLRLRNSILAADLARHEDKATGLRLDRAKWMAIALFALLLGVVYLSWCRYMSVEMEYIRERREKEFFGGI